MPALDRCPYCGAEPDWRRPATKALRSEVFCNVHTARWRVLEFEPLTKAATARRDVALSEQRVKDEAELPRPARAEFDKAGAAERVKVKRAARVKGGK
jgi:hypothetical protein